MMKDNSPISENARKLIFEQDHNYKTLAALYNMNTDQIHYRIKRMKEDPHFAQEFGQKIGSLTYKQKLMLYEEWGEVV